MSQNDDPQHFTIGEFSQISGLSVKALRFYDEKGLLKPAQVDATTGYRYYDVQCIERARVIARLRELQFPLADIGRILAECHDEADMMDAMRRHRRFISDRMQTDAKVVRALDKLIAQESETARLVDSGAFSIEEKEIGVMLVAGLRMKGRYDECGRGFSIVGRAMGRHIAGRPFCLYYDGEFREDDAEYETCFPLRREVKPSGDITVRVLPAERCLCLVHQGPYPQLGRSYRRLFSEARKRGVHIRIPTREVYLKGPGMIFRGNPMRYVTEIQLPLEEV